MDCENRKNLVYLEGERKGRARRKHEVYEQSNGTLTTMKLEKQQISIPITTIIIIIILSDT